MNTSTKASMKAIQLRNPKKQNTWKQVKEMHLNPYEAGKIDYTEEENYEAYKVFSIMDVDNSGCITIRELQRLLMGKFSKTMPMDFDHPDTGIIWGLDKHNNVIVKNIEKDSPASKCFDIIPGFKLRKVNDVDITQENKVGLKQLHKELIRSGHGAIHYDFFEPFFLVSKFTVSLDVEVEGNIYSATLPIGAVNEIHEFEEAVEEALRKAHSILGFIRCRVDHASRQVRFECEEYPFRLLFATGPHYQISCRYAIGFWAEDFDYANIHVGQPLTIDLKMTLKEHEMDILLVELFNTFDTDNSGEFRFEEFRNFYVQFLSSQEKLQRMKDYADFRFRNLEEENRMLAILEARRRKAQRREQLKIKNADKIIIHMKKMKENSRIDEDGVKRRIFRDKKREDQVTVRHKKKNRGGGPTAVVHYGANKTTAVEAEASMDDISRAKRRTFEIKKKQEIARKLKLNRAFADIDVRKKDNKAAAMDAKKRFVRLHMAEVVAAFRACQEDTGNRTESVHNETGLLSFSMTYEKMIQSPQLRFFDSFGVPDVEDIEMDAVPSTKLHPAGISYFFIKKRPGHDYDSRKIHPSFFGADYERESSKASNVALGAARVMMNDMNAVVKKRARRITAVQRNSCDSKQSAIAAPRLKNGEFDWDAIEDVVPPSKKKAIKSKGYNYIKVIESTACEVTNAVISWGTTLVVLGRLREEMNSVLLQQMSTVRQIDERYQDSSSAVQMMEKIVVTGNVFDAIGRLIKPSGDKSLSSYAAGDSIEDINKLFEKHAQARQAQREEQQRHEEEVRWTKRAGRFGPDEIFRKEAFQEEASDQSSGKSSLSGFLKRTVNAGFYLEREVVQPMKKRRTGQADLNAMNAGLDEEEAVIADPGGVNTCHPLSVMLLNQLAETDPAYKAHMHSPSRAQRPQTQHGKGVVDAPPPMEAWGVIGPAVRVELGSTSLEGSGGSAVPAGGKSGSRHDVRYSTIAAAPASAISEEEDSLLGLVRAGRPATAYGLDKSVYEDGQGDKYRGFRHVPIAASTVKQPIKLEEMLDRLHAKPQPDASDSEGSTEADDTSRHDQREYEEVQLDGTEEDPRGALDASDSISLSSQTVTSDVKRYRRSGKHPHPDHEEVSLASHSVASPLLDRADDDDEEEDAVSLNSEMTDPIQTRRKGSMPTRSRLQSRDDDDADDAISLDSASVSPNSPAQINQPEEPGQDRDAMKTSKGKKKNTGKPALPQKYRLRATIRKEQDNDSQASSDKDSDNKAGPEAATAGSDDESFVDSESDEAASGDDEAESGSETQSEDSSEAGTESAADSDDDSSGDSNSDDDDDLADDMSRHSIDKLQRMKANMNSSVCSDATSSAASIDPKNATISRIRMMRMKMLEIENQAHMASERGGTAISIPLVDGGHIDHPSVSLASDTTAMESGGTVAAAGSMPSHASSGVLLILDSSVSLHSRSVDQAPSSVDGTEEGADRMRILPDSVSLHSQSLAETSEGRSETDRQLAMLANDDRYMIPPAGGSVSLASQSMVSDDDDDAPEYQPQLMLSKHDSVSLDSESQADHDLKPGSPEQYDYLADEIENMNEDVISLDSASAASRQPSRHQSRYQNNISLQSVSEELSSLHALERREGIDLDDSVSEISDNGDSPEQCVARYAWAVLIASTSRLFVKSVISICTQTYEQRGSVFDVAGAGGSVILSTGAEAGDGDVVAPLSSDVVLVTDAMPQLLNVLTPIDVISQFADAAVSIYLGEAMYKLEKLGYRNSNGLIVYRGINDVMTRDQLKESVRREKRELKKAARANKRLKKTMARVRKHEEKLAKKKAKLAKKQQQRSKRAHHITGRPKAIKRRDGIISTIASSRRSDSETQSKTSKASKASIPEKHERKEEKVTFKPIYAKVNFVGFKVDCPPSLLQTAVVRDQQVVLEPRLVYLSAWTPRGSWSARTIPKAMVGTDVVGDNIGTVTAKDSSGSSFSPSGKQVRSTGVDSFRSMLDRKDDKLRHLQQQHSSLMVGNTSVGGADLTQSVFQSLKIGELAFENSVLDANSYIGGSRPPGGSSLIMLDTIPEGLNGGSSNKLRKESEAEGGFAAGAGSGRDTMRTLLKAEQMSFMEIADDMNQPSAVQVEPNGIHKADSQHPDIDAEDGLQPQRTEPEYSADFELLSEQDSGSGAYEYIDLDEYNESRGSSRDGSDSRASSPHPSGSRNVPRDDVSELSGDERDVGEEGNGDEASLPPKEGVDRTTVSGRKYANEANISTKVFDGKIDRPGSTGSASSSHEDIDEGTILSLVDGEGLAENQGASQVGSESLTESQESGPILIADRRRFNGAEGSSVQSSLDHSTSHGYVSLSSAEDAMTDDAMYQKISLDSSGMASEGIARMDFDNNAVARRSTNASLNQGAVSLDSRTEAVSLESESDRMTTGRFTSRSQLGSVSEEDPRGQLTRRSTNTSSKKHVVVSLDTSTEKSKSRRSTDTSHSHSIHDEGISLESESEQHIGTARHTSRSLLVSVTEELTGDYVSVASASSGMIDLGEEEVSLASVSSAGGLYRGGGGDKDDSAVSDYKQSVIAQAMLLDNDASAGSMGAAGEATIWWPELEAPRKQSAVTFADEVDDNGSAIRGQASSILLPHLSSALENEKRSITSLQRELVLHKPREWASGAIRVYQEMKFEIRDGVTTDVVAEFSIPFEDFVANLDEEHKCKKKLKFDVRFPCKDKQGNVQPDLTLRGVLECEVDASDPKPVVAKYDDINHFQMHRPQHWTVFPNCPINIGIVRQKYKDIARQYDRQRIVNPTMFGFRVRYYGHEKDESKFTHPMFTGYTLGRKPATREQMEALHLQEVRELNPNPWRWQPGLEKLGLCPICTTGLTGCPRCFQMPVKDSGEISRPEDFQYDPEKDLAKRAAREAKVTQKSAAIALKKRTRRFLVEAGVMSDHGSDEEQDSDSSGHQTGDEGAEALAKGELHLHTKLTTAEGLRLWRNIVQVRLTVWIKVMPGGEVRRYGVEANDPMWHLHNMFLSHSEYGNTKGGMLVLPTYNGFFEMDNVIEIENEHVTNKDTGRLLVKKYGMRQRDNVIALLFFPQYKRQYLPSLFKGFYNQNVENLLTKELHVYSELYYLPEDLSQDLVQTDLKLIFDRHYLEQQLHYKAKIRQREIEFAARLHQKGVEARKARRNAKLEEEQRLRQEERRIESQLKGLEGEERETKRRILMSRLMERNQQVISDSASGEARRRLAKRQTRLEVLRNKRLANKVAAGVPLQSVIEGLNEEDDLSESDDEDFSIRSGRSLNSINSLNTKLVIELSSSQISHVMASKLESSLVDMPALDERSNASDVSFSETSADTRMEPTISLVIDPSLRDIRKATGDLVSLTDTSAASSDGLSDTYADDVHISHVMANSLAESLKMRGTTVGSSVALDSSRRTPVTKASEDSNSRASSLRNKFRHVHRDASDHEAPDGDTSSVMSDVSDVSDVKRIVDEHNISVKGPGKESRPNTSRGGDAELVHHPKPSGLMGLDLSGAGPQKGSLHPQDVSLSDEESSVASLPSASSIGSRQQKTPAGMRCHPVKLSVGGSDNSIHSEDSSIGFHPAAAFSLDNTSHQSRSSSQSRASKQESFLFKKYEVTSIQDHNVKASLLGHARMQSADQSDGSVDTHSVPSALQSSHIDQPGIQVAKRHFTAKRDDSESKAAIISLLLSHNEDDEVSLGSHSSYGINIAATTTGLDQSALASDVDISSSSDESRDVCGQVKNRKQSNHKKKASSRGGGSAAPSFSGDDEQRDQAETSAKKRKKKRKKKSDGEEGSAAAVLEPIHDLHEHTRGITVKKPYSTGYSNKLLKPIPSTDQRAIETAALSAKLPPVSPSQQSKKLDPMADTAAKTYESTFMRFLNPAFRNSHKKT